mgnify:CR=1 FL=1
MSQPNIPNITPTINIDQDSVLNVLLASIALEEIGLAHIINAEGEKIQHAIEITNGLQGEDILRINRNVQDTLSMVLKKELLLDNKLKQIINMLMNP